MVKIIKKKGEYKVIIMILEGGIVLRDRDGVWLDYDEKEWHLSFGINRGRYKILARNEL